MDLINQAWLWVQENPVITGLIVLYVVLGMLPRPHPDKVLSPTAQHFWAIADRLLIFSAERVPGRVKMIFARSVAQPEPEKKAEAPKEGPTP